MSKNKEPLNQPLSTEEIDELHDFLWEKYEDNEKALTLEMVDGLFCALVINPRITMPSEWLEVVFDVENVFASEKEANRIMNLLFRHYNRVNYLIQHRSKENKVTADNIYIPLVFERDEDDDYKFAEQWATGFRTGISYCEDEWDKLLLTENDETEEIAAILMLALLLELGHNPDNEEQIISDEERKEIFMSLPIAVYAVYDYWQAKKQQQKVTARTKQKVGRNDPCPCGSGKKYKKCCEGKESVFAA
jgi:uncharacterized protein